VTPNHETGVGLAETVEEFEKRAKRGTRVQSGVRRFHDRPTRK